MSEYIIPLLISMLPVTELRLAIPVAIFQYKLSLPAAFFISIIGNALAVLGVLILLPVVEAIASRHLPLFKNLLDKLFAYTRVRHQKRFEVLKDLSLIIIVAIPLPLTGGWTGALAAYVFGIPTKKAFGLILLGLLIAGVIVTLVSAGVLLRP